MISNSPRIVTPEFRLAFPAVFEPELGPNPKPNDVPRYSVMMMFPKTADLAPMREILRKAAMGRWPTADKRPKSIRNPIRDGDSVEWEGFAGNWFAKAASTFAPGVVDRKCVKIINPELAYPGVWCLAEVSAWAYDVSGNAGVAFNLWNLQVVRDDEPFFKRSNAAEVFKPLDPVETGKDNPANYAGGEKAPAADPDGLTF